MMLRWVGASMGAVLVMGHAYGQTAVTSGERLSQWMLKDRQSQKAAGQNNASVTPYYLGSSWFSSTERASQEAQKEALIAAFQKVNFPNTPAAQKQKAAMLDLIQGMQHFVLGRNPMRPKLGRAADSEPSLPCNQPAALERLLEMVIFSLRAAYRGRAFKELSYMLFLTTAVFSP